MQAMPVEDERSMQRSMLAALLGGGEQGDSEPAPEPESDADQQAADTRGATAAAAAAVPLADLARNGAQRQPKTSADVDQPRTVFVRSLPAGTTEPQLRSAMSKFGPLKACRCASAERAAQPAGFRTWREVFAAVAPRIYVVAPRISAGSSWTRRQDSPKAQHSWSTDTQTALPRPAPMASEQSLHVSNRCNTPSLLSACCMPHIFMVLMQATASKPKH